MVAKNATESDSTELLVYFPTNNGFLTLQVRPQAEVSP